MDVGAGDGGYVYHRALREPTTFALAIDASSDALIDGAWKAKRSCLRNAVFLVESIEQIPAALAGVANEVTVHFPWGSLLRGIRGADAAVMAPLAGLLKPDGALRILLSASARDGYPDVRSGDIAGLADRYAAHGLRLIEARDASPEEIVASRSSWAKRLGAPMRRPVVFVRLVRGR